MIPKGLRVDPSFLRIFSRLGMNWWTYINKNPHQQNTSNGKTHVSTLPHHWKSILARGWGVFFSMGKPHGQPAQHQEIFQRSGCINQQLLQSSINKKTGNKKTHTQHTLAGCKVNILPQNTNMNTKNPIVERNVLFQSVWFLGSNQSFSGAYSPHVYPMGQNYTHYRLYIPIKLASQRVFQRFPADNNNQFGLPQRHRRKPGTCRA